MPCLLPACGLVPRIALMKFLAPDTEGAIREFLARIPADIRPEDVWHLTSVFGGLAFDVLMDTDILIQPVVISLRDWLHPEGFMRPGFLRNIAREGITL